MKLNSNNTASKLVNAKTAYRIRRSTPTVDIINHSHVGIDTVKSWLAAVEKQADNEIKQQWNLDINVRVLEPGQKPAKKNWHMVILNNSEQAGVLGYHDYTPGGQPLTKIFTSEAERYHENPATTISHEVAEMISDPYCEKIVRGLDPDGKACYYYYENADPVESDTYQIDNIPMSNFVTPNWFIKGSKPPYDQMGLCTKPFEIRQGGYMLISYDKKSWNEVFEDKEIEKEEESGQILGRRIQDKSKIQRILKHSSRDSRFWKYQSRDEEFILSSYETED